MLGDQTSPDFLNTLKNLARGFLQWTGEEATEGHHPPQAQLHQQQLGSPQHQQPQPADVNEPPKYPRQAAGTLLMAPDGRALFLRRNGSADQGGTWSIPGGHARDNELPWQTALRETEEEVGDIELTQDDLHLLDHSYDANTGQGYTTYGAKVMDAFTPQLNNEHDNHHWAPLGQAPQPLHPGLKSTMDFALDPLTAKGEKIMKAMKDQYGEEKGEQVFYASANKGTISGVHGDAAGMRPNSPMQNTNSYTPFSANTTTQDVPQTDPHSWPWDSPQWQQQTPQGLNPQSQNDWGNLDWKWERSQKRTGPDGTIDTATFRVGPKTDMPPPGAQQGMPQQQQPSLDLMNGPPSPTDMGGGAQQMAQQNDQGGQRPQPSGASQMQQRGGIRGPDGWDSLDWNSTQPGGRRRGYDQTGKFQEIKEAVSGKVRDPDAVAAATRAKMIGRPALQAKAAAARRSNGDQVSHPAMMSQRYGRGDQVSHPAMRAQRFTRDAGPNVQAAQARQAGGGRQPGTSGGPTRPLYPQQDQLQPRPYRSPPTRDNGMPVQYQPQRQMPRDQRSPMPRPSMTRTTRDQPARPMLQPQPSVAPTRDLCDAGTMAGARQGWQTRGAGGVQGQHSPPNRATDTTSVLAKAMDALRQSVDQLRSSAMSVRNTGTPTGTTGSPEGHRGTHNVPTKYQAAHDYYSYDDAYDYYPPPRRRSPGMDQIHAKLRSMDAMQQRMLQSMDAISRRLAARDQPQQRSMSPTPPRPPMTMGQPTPPNKQIPPPTQRDQVPAPRPAIAGQRQGPVQRDQRPMMLRAGTDRTNNQLRPVMPARDVSQANVWMPKPQIEQSKKVGLAPRGRLPPQSYRLTSGGHHTWIDTPE